MTNTEITMQVGILKADFSNKAIEKTFLNTRVHSNGVEFFLDLPYHNTYFEKLLSEVKRIFGKEFHIEANGKVISAHINKTNSDL